MKVLSLANMPELTESDLKRILNIGQAPTESKGATSFTNSRPAKDLNAIILLETLQISVNFLLDHMGLHDIYHSAPFRRAMEGQGYREWYEIKEPTPALQFSDANIVSQLIWVGITSKQSRDEKSRYDSGHFDWSSLEYFALSYDRSYFETFSRSGLVQNTGITYKNFLLDVPSQARKIVRSLIRLTHYLSIVNRLEDWPQVAARCFATTSNSHDGGYGVGPLRTTLYSDEACYERQRVGSSKGKALPADQWAVILIQEAFDARSQQSLDEEGTNADDETGEVEKLKVEEEESRFKPLKRLRYAFIKALPESDSSKQPLLVNDVFGYIDDVLSGYDKQEVKRLKKWLGKMDWFATYYSDDDMDDILRRSIRVGSWWCINVLSATSGIGERMMRRWPMLNGFGTQCSNEYE